jgi:hypothetical protein
MAVTPPPPLEKGLPLARPRVQPYLEGANLQHEFGHVVTLLGGESEGRRRADRRAGRVHRLRRQPLSNYARLGDLGEYLGTHRWNGDVRSLDTSIYSNDLVNVSAAYAMGFLTWRCIATRYGSAGTRRFMTDAVHEQFDIDYSSRTALGVTWAQLSRACAPSIRGAVS